jgi:TorA maturation chaperone TorD
MISDAMTTECSKILELLSNLYLCKPTKEAIKNWKALLSHDVPRSLSGLKEAIDKIDLNSEQELEDLLWEFTRLFIGPYKLPCPPWESVYISGRRLMMQEAYDEVQDFYQDVGLEIRNPEINADHIGAELNFLAVLYGKMNGDPEKRLYYMDIAKRFLDEHLMSWIPQFTLDMEEAADFALYKTLAQVTREFIGAKCNGFA